MARRVNGVGNLQSKPKAQRKVFVERLDYHEGLSHNQVKIILKELGYGDRIKQFGNWMCGQTCPIVQRHSRDTGELKATGGVYEYDLFRWIESQRTGSPLIFD